MTQNLIDLVLPDAPLASIDAAIDTLEAALAGLISLTAVQRHRIHKMGDRTEPFCRQSLRVLQQNPQIVPPTLALGLDGALSDLETLDRLRPRLIRLQQLLGRAEDSEMALGSDVLEVALVGYKLVKAIGSQHGLDPARRELALRFERGRRAVEAAPATD